MAKLIEQLVNETNIVGSNSSDGHVNEIYILDENGKIIYLNELGNCGSLLPIEGKCADYNFEELEKNG